MIRLLKGEIATVTEGYVTVLVGGVGYLVGTNTKTTNFKIGEHVTLHTYLAVRETALDLYGFLTPNELDLFELLLLVPKIGPKSALQILNQASPTLLVEAIGKKDPAYLHKLSGIGKKTCENIIQFLQEKIDGLILTHGYDTAPQFSATQTDAIDALVALGYDLATARASVKSLSEEHTTNELITAALKSLS